MALASVFSSSAMNSLASGAPSNVRLSFFSSMARMFDARLVPASRFLPSSVSRNFPSASTRRTTSGGHPGLRARTQRQPDHAVRPAREAGLSDGRQRKREDFSNNLPAKNDQAFRANSFEASGFDVLSDIFSNANDCHFPRAISTSFRRFTLPDITPPITVTHIEERANSTTEYEARLSKIIRITPSAARRSAKGSFEPVGFSSIAQKPTSVSILSASATAIDTGSVGTRSVGPCGL